jgi:hypothetical protein
MGKNVTEGVVVKIVSAVRDELLGEIESLKQLAAEVFGTRGEQPGAPGSAVGILGKAPPASAATAAKPEVISIHEIGSRSLAVQEARHQAEQTRRANMDQSYKDLRDGFRDRELAFDHDAFADPEKDQGAPGDRDILAITYLQHRMVQDNWTLPQALDYAVEREWTRPLTRFEVLLGELRERFQKRIVRFVSDDGGQINVHEALEKACEAGEITTAEQLHDVAEKYRWLRDYDPNRITVRDKIDAERAAELEEFTRQEGQRGKRVGNRGKGTRKRGGR